MADLRPQYTEEAVGANHPTKADVINRAWNIEHEEDGTHTAFMGGNIGIGIANPVFPLHIYHASDNYLLIVESGDATSGIKFKDNTTTGGSEPRIAAVGDTLKFHGLTVDNIHIDAAGKVGIGGVTNPLAKLHIDQAVNDAVIPTLILDQADISEGFINFIGSDRGIITGATNSLKSVRVELGGIVYRLALYVDA